MLTATGCAHTDARLIAAAETKGTVAAGVQLADLPDECREKMPRVYPKFESEKPRNTQLRWEVVADGVDRRTDRCAAFYDEQRAALENRN